jgi:hypothetical protein
MSFPEEAKQGSPTASGQPDPTDRPAAKAFGRFAGTSIPTGEIGRGIGSPALALHIRGRR